MRCSNRFVTPSAITLVALGLVACGGSTTKTTRTTARPATTTSAASPTQTSGTAGGSGSGAAGAEAAVSTGPVHAILKGANHAPVAGRNWVYTVTASDASGRPLTGTVSSQFVFSGQVVGHETPPTHPLKNGRLRDVMVFPARAEGIPLTFQTVVKTPAGTVTLDWPVTVKP